MKFANMTNVANLAGIIFAISFSTTALSGCTLFSSKNARTEEFGSKKKEKDPVAVKAITVKKEVLPRMLEATVSLAGLKQVDIYSRVAGRLSSRNFREGDAVKQGQVLFKIDRTDPGENFQATPVESPVNGWVAQWNADIGSQITLQTSIVQIVDDHILKATVSLPSKDWTFITPRSEVSVETAGQSRKARVTSISRAADPVSGRGTFEIEIDNSARSWRAGTSAIVTIKVEPKLRIILTAQALILTDQGAFVYAIENNIAVRTPVKYEMLSNDSAEIVSGLGAETLIATSGNNLLSHNTPVKIVEDKREEPSNGTPAPNARPRQ
jgi:multidrug efflux pump subunit AcrA (membrane-fusion protein)